MSDQTPIDTKNLATKFAAVMDAVDAGKAGRWKECAALWDRVIELSESPEGALREVHRVRAGAGDQGN